MAKLFGTAGIRGKVFEFLTPELSLDIGKALGSYLEKGSKVCIATDTRTSNAMIKNALISGILSAGVSVTDLGIIPTSALAFLTKDMGFSTGLMITASHNPPEFNGIKFWNADSIGYSREQEAEIEKTTSEKKFRQVSWNEIGKLTTEDARERYIKFMQDRFPRNSFKNPNLKVVVDPGNGAASGFASELFKRLGLEVLPINDEPDGSFPGRDPEPGEKTLHKTVEFLRSNNADVAVCFDGDADRVMFCDKEGFIGYNEGVAYISRLAAEMSGNPKIATTVETGMLVDLALKDINGSILRGRVGDIDVAHMARDEKACIGVEQVGVYIFPDIGFYPEVFYSSLLLLSRIGKPEEIREFFKKIPRLHFIKEGVECSDETKYDVVKRTENFLSALNPKSVNTLDGLRLEFGDAWMLIRASGTQPLIRVITESDNEQRAGELSRAGIGIVKKAMEEGA